MPEILTESFCERCGTRYTFESAAPKVKLKGLKVMSRGLRNFVLSDDSSMDEAMAAARNETDREQTSQQLDAFHKTFNFCMTCRQYTCGNCWNEAEGRCLSCAPNLGQDIMPAPFGNVAAGGAMTLTSSEAVELHERNGHDAPAVQDAPLAWPTSDLMREEELAAETPTWAMPVEEQIEPEVAAAPEVLAEPDAPVMPDIAIEPEPAPSIAPEPAPSIAPEPTPSIAAEPTPSIAAEAAPEDESFDFAARLAAVTGPASAPPEVEQEPVIETPVTLEPPAEPVPLDDRAAAASANTSDLLQRFRPGQSLDDEIEAYERAQATAAPDAVAPGPAVPQPPVEPTAPVEPPAPSIPEPTPIAASAEPIYPEPEPVPVETFAPEPEPVAFEPEPEPVAFQPELVTPIDPGTDYVPQPTWQIVAPDTPTSDGIAAQPVQQPAPPPADAIAASAEPQWPATPQWPDRDASQGLPFLGRPAAATGGMDALWAASVQEVAQVPQTGQPSPIAMAGPTVAKPAGIQPCVSCGLSLSANARFCRRCGTRQD